MRDGIVRCADSVSSRLRIGASITAVAWTPRPCGPIPQLITFCRTDEASVLRWGLVKFRQLLMRRSLAR